MLMAFWKRTDEDKGFTLIELMVVVLIIGILIAIALPTFLGLRRRAQDRAAQSDLRNGLATGKAFYTDNETYGDADGAGPLTAFDQAVAEGIEPALTWLAAAGTSDATNQGIAWGIANNGATFPNQILGLARMSVSGTCFYLTTIESGPNAGQYRNEDDTAPVCTGAVAVGFSTGDTW